MNHSADGVVAVGAPHSDARKENNRAAFMAIYTKQLERAVQEYPEEYSWPVENVPAVAERMRVALNRNSYNADSRAIRATCKQLGIKHTRKAINSFWEGEDHAENNRKG